MTLASNPGSKTASPEVGEAVVIQETALHGTLPLFAQPLWLDRFPWLVQATTGRGSDQHDLSFFGRSETGRVQGRWRALRTALAMEGVLHAHQVHGADIVEPDQLISGITILNDADGLVTAQGGLLLAVSVADCVPISLVDKHARGIALLHAGWRGVAAGILEHGVTRLLARTGGTANDLYCHFGPAICGRCYEVGPEVHEALGAPRPDRNLPVDLRALLVRRAFAVGVPDKQVSQSAFCTRCHQDLFFSHRGADRERQMGLLGLRVT